MACCDKAELMFCFVFFTSQVIDITCAIIGVLLFVGHVCVLSLGFRPRLSSVPILGSKTITCKSL